MKDKLVKTGHLKPYYVLRSFLLVLGLIALAIILLSIPVGVKYALYLKTLPVKGAVTDVKELLITSFGL